MIFHEYGELPSGKTIHSKLQLKDNNCEVYDDPERLAGRQCLITQEGYHIPMDFKQGLAYIKMHFPTEDEVKNLPCVVMTRDFPWDPSRYDKVKSNDVPVLPIPTTVPDPIHPPLKLDYSINAVYLDSIRINCDVTGFYSVKSEFISF